MATEFDRLMPERAEEEEAVRPGNELLLMVCRDVKVPRKPRSALANRGAGKAATDVGSGVPTGAAAVGEETLKLREGLLRFCTYPKVPRKPRSSLGNGASVEEAPPTEVGSLATVTEASVAEKEVADEDAGGDWSRASLFPDEECCGIAWKSSSSTSWLEAPPPTWSERKGGRKKRAADWPYDADLISRDGNARDFLNGKRFCLRGGKQMFEEEMEDAISFVGLLSC